MIFSMAVTCLAAILLLIFDSQKLMTDVMERSRIYDRHIGRAGCLKLKDDDLTC